jgi:hypothetical protein
MTQHYDPRDVDDLASALATVRDLHPDATSVMFDVLDTGERGYRVVDVVLRGERSLAATNPEALTGLDDAVYDRVSNLAWRGVLGASKYGCSLVPVDWRAPALV